MVQPIKEGRRGREKILRRLYLSLWNERMDSVKDVNVAVGYELEERGRKRLED